MDIPGYLRARVTRILSIGGCLLGLFAIHLVIFHDHWLGRKWFPFDFPAGYYATVAYWVTSLQSGEWPHWIPYQSMGYPLLMNPQMGFFYPPFWIFVVLHIPFTLHAAVIVQILHVLFGSIGFLLLANRLFGSLLAAECGAAAFLFFGGFYSNAEHADIIRGFAWVPWLLWSSVTADSQLDIRNLTLPVLLACFITGAYTGQVIAALFLLLVYLIIQAAQHFYASRNTAIARSLLLQFALIALGLMLSGAFLLTGAALAGELTRSRGVNALPIAWLTPRNLFDLLFPSNLLHPGEDYSMVGMQTPIVLFLFAPLISIKSLKKLLPFLTIGVLAVVMSFATFARASNAVRHLLPVLGLSRFPPSDYREFFYLALLLLATGGLASAIRDGSHCWKKAAGVSFVSALFGLVCVTCLQHDVAPASFTVFLRVAKAGMLMALGTSLLFVLCCWFGKPKIAGFALLPLMSFAMSPVLDGEKQFWADPDLLKNVYDGHGFPIEVGGELRTRAIFRRHETERGPRATADNVHLLSWWGYLDGAYLTNDSGGVIPLTRRAAESDSALLRFAEETGQIVQIPCNSSANVCETESPAVNLSNRLPAGRPVEFSRNALTYEVDVAERSLIVENEMAIRGWHAAIDGIEAPVMKVDACFRGWIVQPGRHLVRLHYRTPLLIPGLLLSCIGLAAWIAALWLFRGAGRFQKTSPSCVILVSSDRTGG